MSTSAHAPEALPDLEPNAPPTRGVADRATLLVCGLGACLAIGITLLRLCKDGSFWLDEASVALNLVYRGPFELFGRLETDHSFPRLYLTAIRLLQEFTGYGTRSARFLPWLAFVASASLWTWALRERFTRLPLVAFVAFALALLPGTWLAYGAMFKQYSLDACVALVPLAWSDRFLTSLFRDRRRPWLLVVLCLPCVVSFIYVIPLLARVLAYLAFGLARRRPVIAPGPGIVFALGLLASLGLAYAIDLRFATLQPGKDHFFAQCMIGSATGDDLEILQSFFFGWFSPGVPHGTAPELPAAGVGALAVALGLGVLAITARWLAPRFGRALPAEADAALERWGSRSLMSVAVLIGAPLASWVVGYPICAGRLSLFAYFHLVWVIAEGVASPGLFGARGRLGSHAVALAIGAMLVVPTARNLHFLATSPLQENVRELLPTIAEHPERLIVVPPCSTRQIETLPEWLARDDLFFARADMLAGGDGYPDASEYWLLSVGAGFYCPWYARGIERRGATLVQQGPRGRAAALFHVLAPPATQAKGASAR